jgi:uncharacterized iron-regulated membrane protein
MAEAGNQYARLWRWHFYAGLIIAPVLIIMSVTGGMYLLQPQIEDALYGELLYLPDPHAGPVDHDALIATATTRLEAARLHAYTPPQGPEHSAAVDLTTQTGDRLTAYLSPATGDILGTVAEDWRPMTLARKIHGGLMLGKPGDVIVELVACWTLVMVATGLFLWWPRKSRAVGTALPRAKIRGRAFWRDWHAVPGAWAGLWIAAIIVTGLPWSILWGGAYAAIGKATGEGLPAAIFTERPHSVSDAAMPDVTMNELIARITAQDVSLAYKIDYPWFANGVYAVMPLRQIGQAEDMAYLFLDRRSGAVLTDLRWDDLGALGRASTIGVQFHEGRLFGPANQIINLAAILILIALALTGPVMWWKRRPKGKLAPPVVPRDTRLSIGVLTIATALALILPLFALSVLLILAGEWVWAQRKGANA